MAAALSYCGGTDPADVEILLVDDQPSRLLTYEAILSPLGHRLVTATSGVEALRRLMEGGFAVILLDVSMPDMDGYELYQAVKKTTPGLPVVLMTAFNYDKDHIIKRSCLEGLQGVIFKKPVNPAMLKKILLQQCRPEQSSKAPSRHSRPTDTGVTSKPN